MRTRCKLLRTVLTVFQVRATIVSLRKLRCHPPDFNDRFALSRLTYFLDNIKLKKRTPFESKDPVVDC